MKRDSDAPDETGINPSVTSVCCDQTLFTRIGTHSAEEFGFYEVECLDFDRQKFLGHAAIE